MAVRGHQSKTPKGTPAPPTNRNGMTHEEKLNEPAEVLKAARLVRDYCAQQTACVDGCLFQTLDDTGQPGGCRIRDYYGTLPQDWRLD